MKPKWAQRLPWDVISDEAKALALDPNLIAAIIQKESAGIAWRTRYETKFRWFVDPNEHINRLGVTAVTELNQQATSWGLMQIMGATARGMGFRGYFPELCGPQLGIYWGALYLRSRVRATRTIEEAIATYNAGPGELSDGDIDNVGYVNAVMGFYRELVSS